MGGSEENGAQEQATKYFASKYGILSIKFVI